MVPGYAYCSLKTLENVVVTQSDCDKAKFCGLVRIHQCDYAKFGLNGKHYWQLTTHTLNDTVRAFSLNDCQSMDSWDKLRLSADRSELLSTPMWWHKHGIQETPTGYGKALNSGLMVWFEGRYRRVYVTCYSNVGTSWFRYQGKKIVIG